MEGAAMKDIEKLSSQPGPLNRLARFLIDTARMKRHEHQIHEHQIEEVQALVHQIQEVQALAQRLDSDIVRGFAALVERLDNDLSRLKENAQEHSQAVFQIIDQMSGLAEQVRRGALPRTHDHPSAIGTTPRRDGGVRETAQPSAASSSPAPTGASSAQTAATSSDSAGFDLGTSRQYWRLAPSGIGKHDTAELREMSADQLEGLWNEAYTARMRVYPEEAEFLKAIAPELNGKRVLSIGSGLGLLEIFLQSRGATLTCADIVDSNLAVIRKISERKNGRAISTILIEEADQSFGGPYDVVLIYGSLMTMPEAMQRSLLRRCRAALVPEGSIILMLYTWEFARATRGWSSQDEFDPKTFALSSDPTVGEEDCPWSDWHDDSKLLALVDGELETKRRQFFNQGWYIWYELGKAGEGHSPSLFFHPDGLTEGDILEEVALVRGRLGRAQAGVRFTISAPGAEYLWVDMARQRSKLNERANTVLLEVDVEQGALSIGLLDLERQTFAFSQAVWQPGRHTHVFTISEVPAQFSVVVSNFPQSGSSQASFVLNRIALLDRPEAVPSLPGLNEGGQLQRSATL
jgi:2-polyprenyl-3-methyl-5-hydroxy-6-metoxy-1,4-benzoquinol methylase